MNMDGAGLIPGQWVLGLGDEYVEIHYTILSTSEQVLNSP